MMSSPLARSNRINSFHHLSIFAEEAVLETLPFGKELSKEALLPYWLSKLKQQHVPVSHSDSSIFCQYPLFPL